VRDESALQAGPLGQRVKVPGAQWGGRPVEDELQHVLLGTRDRALDACPSAAGAVSPEEAGQVRVGRPRVVRAQRGEVREHARAVARRMQRVPAG